MESLPAALLSNVDYGLATIEGFGSLDRLVHPLPRYLGQVRLLHRTHRRLQPPAFPQCPVGLSGHSPCGSGSGEYFDGWHCCSSRALPTDRLEADLREMQLRASWG
jgi:hypothetical protein